MTITAEQDVLRLHIAVDNVATMEIFECEQELCCIELRHVFIKATAASEQVEELTLRTD